MVVWAWERTWGNVAVMWGNLLASVEDEVGQRLV